MEIGGVTVFGLPAELPIWVDARVMGGSGSCSAADRGRGRCIAPPAILLALPGVEVVEGLATEPDAASGGLTA